VLVAVDANQDGVISAEEIAAAPAKLKALDRNHDGVIDTAELMPAGRGRGDGGEGGREGREGGGGGPATSADELVATLMAFDANHDGQLVKSELPERMQPLFDRADANKDGKLSVDEIRKSAQSSANAASGGARGEGGERGEREGVRGGPGRGGFDPMLAALDANHDGLLQADEVRGAADALRALDKNHDGRLTADEYRPAGRSG
jgi:Ca2+-binding EF-hand superfamily protein